MIYPPENSKTIRLQYRKRIDARTVSSWDKWLWEDTYKEYKLQVQNYDPGGKYPVFTELLRQEPKAEKLHYLVSAAVRGYLQQLNGIIPDIRNTVGDTIIPFTQFKFEILQSNTKNIQDHQVALDFYSEPVKWMDRIGEHLLISLQEGEQESLTHLIALQPGLNIYSIIKLSTHDQDHKGPDLSV